MSDGLLFIGVDGVLNPWNVPHDTTPPGYETYYRARHWNPGGFVAPTWFGLGPVPHGTPVWLNPGHGPMLMRVAERWNLELVWASWWGQDAVRLVAPVLGLPAMRVVPLSPCMATPEAHWKRPFIKDFAGDQPFAWLSDWFCSADYVWAGSRQIKMGIPTLVQSVDPRLGLTQKDVDTVDTYFWGMQ